MNTMNVNGQNGVATSAAIKNAVVKAVKMINKADNAKRSYVKIGEGTRLSFDGQRFIKEGKDNFIFNGWIEYKGSNGRYYEKINVSYKNLDNEEGLCLNDMVNGVLDAILNYIDSTIVKCEGGDGFNTYYAEILQNFRYCYFGSRLVVDNTEDLNRPDALDNDENDRPDALVDAMVKNYIDDFYGKPENELDLAKVHSYLEFVRELNTTTHRDFENDLLAIMTVNLLQISLYLTTLYNWEIMPMADDDDLKMVFENKVHNFLVIIKDAIKTYITKRDKIAES